MKRLPLLTTVFAGSLFTASLATAAMECADLVNPMRTLQANIRSGQLLTPEQQSTWRSWNQSCKAPDWQAALVSSEAPMPDRVVPIVAVPNVAHDDVVYVPPTPTWKEIAANVLLGIADGMTRYPTITCTTHRYGRRNHSTTTTRCY